ncbi:MAG: hypothetical protein PUC21_10210 [Bacteroidales bacterium]|nr:hypothetical protein [Bacteroidales bacterium]
MNIFKRIKASLRLMEAIRKADFAHKQNGGRYYVMPTTGNSGQLIIMDRSAFRKLKQKNYIRQNTFVKDLEAQCFYCTSYKNGNGALSPEVAEAKRLMYLEWINQL